MPTNALASAATIETTVAGAIDLDSVRAEPTLAMVSAATEPSTRTSTGTGTSSPTLIALPGRCDVHQVHWLDSQVTSILATGNSPVIDASEVVFLDGWAIEALWATKFRCIDHGHNLEFLSLSAAARLTLQLTGHLSALVAA
jgi:anti-anti-sigma regulatory factor